MSGAELWAEVKRRVVTSGSALVTALAAALLAIAYLFTKRSKERPRSNTLDPLLEYQAQKVAAANARAAIEIHVASTKEQAVASELAEISRDADGPRRRQRLIELAEKIEGRGE